ncbi:alkaline phosphatase PhoX [Pseudohalioglobus sediminis]|uniref:alkaline phosphatase PhoX n=1 Tax=Pseudohalioglobus sediminis TaxID=2606449 RepID=UPI001CB6C834|nr:alkaline phosphatase PhoX [Pseudohalioglobus sediminis]
MDITRRTLVRSTLLAAGWASSGHLLSACSNSADYATTPLSNMENIGALLAEDRNGIRLPPGFSSKVIAQSGQPVIAGDPFLWGASPDGGACFAQQDGSWIYVCNNELGGNAGGVSAIHFDRTGAPQSAYPILTGTSRNCAGGKLPYGRWLSCEETPTGQVYECDPTGKKPAIVRPLLGVFRHEAAAYDLENHHIYLTEDRPDGKLYRFVPGNFRPDGYADLSSGHLEVAEIVDVVTGAAVWHRLPDPEAHKEETRFQVAEATSFAGGEGIEYHEGKVYFTTKISNQVHVYDTQKQRFSVLYDKKEHDPAILSGVDNIHLNSHGDIFVAEDGGDMQVVVITKGGNIKPLLEIPSHRASEITGPAFSPDLKHFYFSSQRGASGSVFDGTTYQITGPFFISS